MCVQVQRQYPTCDIYRSIINRAFESGVLWRKINNLLYTCTYVHMYVFLKGWAAEIYNGLRLSSSSKVLRHLKQVWIGNATTHTDAAFPESWNWGGKWGLMEYKWKGSFPGWSFCSSSRQKRFLSCLAALESIKYFFSSPPAHFCTLCVPIAQEPG